MDNANASSITLIYTVCAGEAATVDALHVAYTVSKQLFLKSPQIMKPQAVACLPVNHFYFHCLSYQSQNKKIVSFGYLFSKKQIFFIKKVSPRGLS